VSRPHPTPRPLPTLDAVAAHPDLAMGLPLTTLVDLRRQAACVVAELDARIQLALGQAPSPAARPEARSGERDQTLTPAEAAALLGVTPRWLRQHAAELQSFTFRLNRKTVRYSRAGLTRWMGARQG
jgi:hypothetical protein